MRGYNATGESYYHADRGPFVKMLEADTRLEVGAQTGTMKAGATGAEVEFPFTVSTIVPAGSHDAVVAGLPTGVTLNGGRVETDYAGHGTFRLRGDGTQTADIYRGLTLTMEGAVSNEFTLEIIL
jgi:hypothetical protein